MFVILEKHGQTSLHMELFTTNQWRAYCNFLILIWNCLEHCILVKFSTITTIPISFNWSGSCLANSITPCTNKIVSPWHLSWLKRFWTFIIFIKGIILHKVTAQLPIIQLIILVQTLLLCYSKKLAMEPYAFLDYLNSENKLYLIIQKNQPW